MSLSVLTLYLLLSSFQSTTGMHIKHSCNMSSDYNKDVCTRMKRQVPNLHMLPDATTYPRFPNGFCRMVFNELKVLTPNAVNSPNVQRSRHQYIETRKTCEQGKYGAEKQDGYRIAEISCETLDMFMFANLKGKKLYQDSPQNYYFVLGSTGLGEPCTPNHCLEFSDPQVQYVGRNEDEVFSSKNGKPNILLLLYSTSPMATFQFFQFPTRNVNGQILKFPLQLTDVLLTIIRRTIQDVLVYNAYGQDKECPSFQTIMNMNVWGRDREFVISNWRQHTQLSINRCVSHSNPFDPYAFKTGTATPLEKNDCTQTFILDDGIEQIVPNVVQNEDENAEVEIPDEVPIPDNNNQIQNYVPGVQEIDFAIPEPPPPTQCPFQLSNLNSHLNGQLSTLSTLNTIIHQHMPPQPFLWMRPIQQKYIHHVQLHLPSLIDEEVVTRDDIKYWFELVPDSHSPNDLTKYRMRCSVCNAFCEGNNRGDQQSSYLRTGVVHPNGIIYNTKTKNNEALIKHLNSKIHQDSVDYIKECSGAGTPRKPTVEAVRESYPPQERFWISTVHMFRLAIQWIKSGASFLQWESIVKHFQEYLPAKLYLTRQGIVQIIKSVSDDIYEYINNQIRMDFPITLMMDGYQDKKGRNVLGLAVMMWFEGSPQIKTYKLKQMGKDSNNQAYFDAILEVLRAAGVDQHVKRNLVAMASDGASVMKATTNSVFAQLKRWTGRNIAMIWCYGHRVNLVIKKAVHKSPLSPVQTIMETLKIIPRIFGATTKDREKLHELLEENGFTRVILTPVKDIRWTHTWSVLLKKVFRFYKYIILMLDRILVDPTTPPPKKAIVEDLLQKMKSKHYPSWLSFLIDVFEEVDRFSLWSQRGNAYALNMAPFRSQFLRTFRRLSNFDGPTTRQLLNEAEIFVQQGQNIQGRSQLWLYDNGQVTWRDVLLRNVDVNDNTPNRLSNSRPIFIQGILKEINEYFPEDENNRWTIFHPNTFRSVNTNGDEFDEFARPNFKKLLESIGYAEEEIPPLFNEWKALLLRIIADPTFHPTPEMKAHEFWNNVRTNDQLRSTAGVRKLLKKLLVLPSGVVELERMFSQVTFAFGNHRLCLKVDTADYILRIRKNLPQDTTNLNVFPFITSWLSKGKSLVDDQNSPWYSRMVNQEQNHNDDANDDQNNDANDDQNNDQNDDILNEDDDADLEIRNLNHEGDDNPDIMRNDDIPPVEYDIFGGYDYLNQAMDVD